MILSLVDNRWVTRFHPLQAPTLRLICFPYAGGSASLFRAWAKPGILPDGVEMCAVELPGHGTRQDEPPLLQLSDVIEGAVPSLLPLVVNTPFAIFGHSLGALLGFEAARLLQKTSGRTPNHLFVSACRAPQLPIARVSIENVAQLMGYLRSLGSNPVESMIERRWDLFHADFALRNRYCYEEKGVLSFPITAFGGEQDGSVPVADLAAWKTQTHSSFTLQMLPGNHFFLQESQTKFLQLLSSSLSLLQKSEETGSSRNLLTSQ